MAEITPRWEWRSFGLHFGEAEGRLAWLTPSGVQESDEIYLLSRAGENVKVRDALMDIKVLREVNADGLEQWTPVMKAGFPLQAAEVAKVLEALRLPIPTPVRASYTLNSIELKLSVPLTGHRATIESIGLDPVEAQPRQAFFFDTPDLALNQTGVVARARRIQDGDADTVVKLRPLDPSTIDPELRRSAAFKVEVDVMPGGYVCSASFKGVCSGEEVLDVTSGATPLRKLFSKEQRAFYDAHAPAGITMDKLVVLGPTFLLKAKHQPKDFDRPITIEM